MITKQSIALAELIAVGAGVPIKPTALIAGLNQETVGAVPYTDDFRNELIQTTQNTAHTELLETASARLAEVIRDAMYNVRDYGIPFAKAVARETRLIYTQKNLSDLANREIGISYQPLDSAFFDSPLYPTTVSDQSLTYESVNLDDLDTLKFNYPSNDEVRAFVGTSHPDVLAVMDNPENIFSVGDLTSTRDLASFFTKEGGVFNFKKIKSMNAGSLLRLYVLVTRMYASEDPVPWLVGGELSVYRRVINLLWNGMTAYMIQLKTLFALYRARKVVVLFEETPKVVGDRWNKNIDAKLLKLSARVLYTDDYMRGLNRQNLSFNEVITGYGWAMATGIAGVSAVTLMESPEKLGDYAKMYYQQLDTTLKSQSRQLFMESGMKAISQFLSDTPVVADRFKTILNGSTELPASWITKRFSGSLENCFHAVSEVIRGTEGYEACLTGEDEGDSPFFEAILSTPLVSDFLKALGCSLAAEVVDATFVNKTTDDNIHDKRQRLHVALINLLVGKSVQVG